MNSMTGFGRGENHTTDLSVTVELSSVNRKQADVQLTLPRALAGLEPQLRKIVLSAISRGRVSGTISIQDNRELVGGLQIDLQKAAALETSFEQLSKQLGRIITPTANDFLRVPEIIVQEDSSICSEHAEEAIIPALRSALHALIAMRASEGEELGADLQSRLETLEQYANEIKVLSPSVVDRYRSVLHKRLDEIGLDLDLSDERILREIALFAERSDISEETTRLQAHFIRFKELSSKHDEAVGRPLDFLCQEINREFNTIGSKANSSDIASHVVDAKTELEKIREQIQNIE